jgi:hypothetical protein
LFFQHTINLKYCQRGKKCFVLGGKWRAPGTKSFLPGTQSFLPGTESFLPGTQSFLPGTETFLPGTETFTASYAPTTHPLHKLKFLPLAPPNASGGGGGSLQNPLLTNLFLSPTTQWIKCFLRLSAGPGQSIRTETPPIFKKVGRPLSLPLHIFESVAVSAAQKPGNSGKTWFLSWSSETR